MAVVSVPAAQSPYDPGEARQGSSGVRIFQLGGLPLEFGGEGFDQRFGGLVHGVAELLARSPGAGIDQLHRAQCGDQHGEDELGHDLRGLDLALLQIEALALHGSEHLLDRPARPIPGDDPQGVFEARHRMRRQENPQDRLDALRRIDLFDPNRAEFDRRRQPFDLIAPARPRDFDLSPAHAGLRNAGGLAYLRGDGDLPPLDMGRRRHRREQLGTAAQDAVVIGAPEQMDVSRAGRGVFLIDVALAIIDEGHHRRFLQREVRRPQTPDPAAGFLGLDRAWDSGVRPPSSCVRPEAPSCDCRCWRPRAR